MSLPIPNLDDRNFEDLMKEALALIPVYDKSWTNYNPSDPGITLLELFSWLSEITIYRINRIPEENYRRFLELLGVKHLFEWGEIPGNVTGLLEYLVETFKVDWVKIAIIEKNDIDRFIDIYFKNDFEGHSIRLKLNDEEDKVTIILENGATHELNVKKELKIYEKSVSSTVDGWLFRWNRIPGTDKDRLINSLIQKDSKYIWLRDACLEKTDKGKNLHFFCEESCLNLRLDDEKSEVTLYEGVSSGTAEEKYRFVVVKDLKIYESLEYDIRRGLQSVSKRCRAITAEDFELLTNECIEALQEGLSGRTICVNNRDLEYDKNSSDNSYPGHVSVIIVPGVEKPEFSWKDISSDDIPGKDNIRILEFIELIYGADWIKSAKIKKSEDGNTVTISEVQNTGNISDSARSISLKLNQTKVILESLFSVQYSEKPEFDWDEIPGKDNILLLEFLENVYGADWIKLAKIEKSEDGSIITISKVTNNETVSDGITFISLKTDQKKKTFESFLYASYLEKPEFSWNDIPGKDSDKFLESLAKIYGADWIKSAKIEKKVDSNTITISKFHNTETASDSVRSISVSSEKKVTLESRFYASYEFTLKEEQGKSNVYCYTVDGKPSDLLKDQVRKYLNKRKLVTTRLHVVEPDYRKATLTASISLKKNTLASAVIENAKNSINKYFSPLDGGKDKIGWPAGRNLYKSEIYQLLEKVPEVDHVVEIKIDGSDLESVELKEYQLIELTVDDIEVCDE